jgi:hypothetical protein
MWFSTPVQTLTRDPELEEKPNKYAAPNGLELDDGLARFRGYQEYSFELAERRLVPLNQALVAKDAAVARVFTPAFMAGRTVLDLGGNNGFFTLRALLSGATSGTVVDVDGECVANVNRLRARLPELPLGAHKVNFERWREPADVVIAFALVHWVYSCTSRLLSLESVVDRIAALARDFAMVEWVDPADPLVEGYRHTQVGPGETFEPYSFERFMDALVARFESVELLGELSPTRRIFLASRRVVPDLSWDAPLVYPKETLLSSRRLWVVEGVEFWSRVYKVGQHVYKQCSPVLAEREYAAIQAVRDPGVVSAELVERAPTYHVLRLPFHAGRTLDEVAARGDLSRGEILSVAGKLVEIVARLRAAGVEHRDVHPANVIVRDDGELRLIDFAWASVPGVRDVTPPPLGTAVLPPATGRLIDVRPPEGGGDDLYAVGRIVRWLDRSGDPALGFVASCLASRDLRLRVTDVVAARRLVAALAADGAGPEGPPLAQLAAIAGGAIADAERSARLVEETEARAERDVRAVAEEHAAERRRLEDELRRREDERRALEAERERLEGEIRWMKGRRIWKLREAWLRTKRALRRRP